MATFHYIAETYLIPVQLVLALFGMGATLRVSDFAAIARDPRGLAVGLGLQWIAVPAATAAFVAALDLPPGWAVGLFLVAAVPGGAFSNLLTFLARGNVALSISVTVVTTAACVGTIPLLLSVLARGHLPAGFALPAGRIVVEIAAYLIGPLLAGMAARRLWPAGALRASRWAIRGSLVGLALVTASALQSGRIRVAEYGWGPPLTLIAYGLLLANLTPPLVRALGRYDDDNVALTIEVAVRNIGIALLLVHHFFPGQREQGHVLYACLFYAGMGGFLALPPLVRHRRGRAPSPVLGPRPRPERAAR